MEGDDALHQNPPAHICAVLSSLSLQGLGFRDNAKEMETTGGYVLGRMEKIANHRGLGFRDNGKENGNYGGLGFRENGKEMETSGV